MTAPFIEVLGVGGNIPAARSEAISGFSPPAGIGEGVIRGCDGGNWVGGNWT